MSLFSRLPREDWEIQDECPVFEKTDLSGQKTRVSLCGRFTIRSRARGSRDERVVAGILKTSPDGASTVLETDPETYADAVTSAEADHLKGEAEAAMRAVVVWNGVRGITRHPEMGSLCDTTHCMVFMGSLPDEPLNSGSRTDPALLDFLDRLALDNRLNWLMFSKGGDEGWRKTLASADMRRILNEPQVLDIRRERSRSGAVLIHLMYPETEETVSCEIIRNAAGLPSCPSRVLRDPGGDAWIFEGAGLGHGMGLSVSRAEAMAAEGYDARAILVDAYGAQTR